MQSTRTSSTLPKPHSLELREARERKRRRVSPCTCRKRGVTILDEAALFARLVADQRACSWLPWGPWGAVKRCNELGDVVQQSVVYLHVDGVSFGHGQVRVDGDAGFGAEPVGDPAHLDVLDGQHAWGVKPIR